MSHGALIGMIALLGIAAMMARGMKGAIIIGIMVASMYGWMFDVYDPYNDFSAGGAGWGTAYATAPDPNDIFGFVGLPEESLGAAITALGDISGNLDDFLLVMIAFLFVDIFDTAGTLYSVGRQAGYVDADDTLQNSEEAFMSDAAATIAGALTGTSTTTCLLYTSDAADD